MINEKSCFSNSHSSRIDLILSNKPCSLLLSCATETGLSDCHKFITTCMKATISHLNLRSYITKTIKKLMNEIFCHIYKKNISNVIK